MQGQILIVVVAVVEPSISGKHVATERLSATMRSVMVSRDKWESEQTLPRRPTWPELRPIVFGLLLATMIGSAVWDVVAPSYVPSISVPVSLGLILALDFFGDVGERTGEKAARERLRSAEQRLVSDVAMQRETGDNSLTTADGRDDQLTLAALWEVTHSRLDLYHQIATKQARRSFFAAQVAAVVGFGVLVGLAIAAIRVHSTVGAITAGTLGTVSAALAGYIGRTFVRSQESAASHLRAYFDQPLEFSRYLAAERLLVGLTSDQRASIIAVLVQDVLVPNATELTKEGKG